MVSHFVELDDIVRVVEEYEQVRPKTSGPYRKRAGRP